MGLALLRIRRSCQRWQFLRSLSHTRGRWIPTTSVDQFASVLANWFGVLIGSSEMETIFPNLNRFEDPFDISGTANLGFLPSYVPPII